MRIAELPEPPLRLILGSDALALARNAYKQFVEETEKWTNISQSTDSDDATNTQAAIDIIDKMASSV